MTRSELSWVDKTIWPAKLRQIRVRQPTVTSSGAPSLFCRRSRKSRVRNIIGTWVAARGEPTTPATIPTPA